MFWFIPLRLFLWKLWGNLALIYAIFSLASLFFFLLVLRTEPQPHTWANATSEPPSHLSSPFLFTRAMTVTVWCQELLASFSQRWDMRVYTDGWLFSVPCSLQTEIAICTLWEFFPPFQLPSLLHSPYLASWNSGLNGEMASLQPGRMIHGLFDKDCRFINTCYDISSIHIFWREMFEKANNHKSLAIIKMPRKITQAPMTFCKIPDQFLSKLLSLLKPRKVWEEKRLLTTILK